jgi:DNA-binding NarL/FixJ family response regulator
MATRRLFIVWSHPLFRETVHVLLDIPAIEVVGMASEFETALARLESLQPDVIIVEETDDDTVTHVEALEILRACSWGPPGTKASIGVLQTQPTFSWVGSIYTVQINQTTNTHSQNALRIFRSLEQHEPNTRKGQIGLVLPPGRQSSNDCRCSPR